MLRTFVLMLGIFLIAHVASAQKDIIAMKGVMKMYGSSKKLTGVTVTLIENGTQKNKVITSSNGKFDFGLVYDKSYKIVFSKNGYVTKNIVVDTRNIPPEEKERGWFEIPMEMSLFEEVEDLDVSILNQPIGKFRFDPGSNDIVHDAQYTAEMKNKINNLMKEYEKRKKEEEKRRQEEEEAAREEAERLAAVEGEFNALMEQGDNAMGSNDFQNAVDNYQKALDLIPNDGIAKDKLADASKKLEDYLTENAEKDKAEAERKAREEAYAAAVKEGDDLFKAKDFEKAKTKYQDALTHKPEEAYPKDRMAECDTKIAEAQAEADRLANLENEYKQTLQDADNAVGEKDYETALVNYQLASEMKPKEKYPKDKMKEVQELILNAQAEEEKLKKLEEQYKGILATADEAFKAEDYEKAVNSYKKALDVKPDEQYPKDQIAAGEKILADRQAEADALAKLEEDYKAAIKEGDKAMGTQEYENALKAYQTATDLKPEEQYPKDQIAAVNTALADMEAEKERLAKLDADYEAAIKEADGLFDGKDYAGAIASYEKASALKAAEQYPKDKIKEANEFIGKKAEYDGFVGQGDVALGAKDYSTAKTAFEKASKLLPNEQYPKDKIAEIEKTLADLKAEADAAAELNANYEAAIKEGDKSFGSKDYDAAKTAYQKAQDLKPNEEYPKTKIGEIDNILSAEASERERLEKLEADYQAAVAKGDELMGGSDYKGAIASFETASSLKPEERYPKDKIKEAQDLLTTQETYAEFVKQADAALAAKDYPTAKTAYESASKTLPDEQYPKDQLAEIAKTLGDLEAAEEAARQKEADYTAAMKEGDKQVTLKDYQTALASYTKASEIKPEEELPKTKIAEMEKLISDMSADEERLAALEAEYKKHIDAADGLMGEKKYQEAISSYQKASDVKPELTYPKDKIKEAELAMSEADRLAQEEAARLAQEAADKEEADRLAALEADRLAQEEKDRLEQERLAQEEKDRLAQDEADRLAQEEKDRLEREAADQAEKDRLAQLEADRLADEEKDRLAREEEERLERERLAQEEADRLAREEADRLAREAQMARANDPDAKYYGERIDGQSETDAERFMREALARDEAEKWERIKKIKEREDEWNADLIEDDYSDIAEADAEIQEIKANHLELGEEKNSSRVQNAEDIVKTKEDRLDWNTDLESGSQDDRIDYKSDLDQAESDRSDMFAERDETRKDNAIERAEYKEAQLGWNNDLNDAAFDDRIEMKANFTQQERERGELFVGKDEQRIKNAEFIVEYKEDRYGWDADLEADAGDTRLDVKSQLNDEEAARVDMFAEKDDPRKENAVERAEYKAAQLDWNADLESDAGDTRLDMKSQLNDAEAERVDMFAEKDEPRKENAIERAEYKESRLEWDTDLIDGATDNRLAVKDNLNQAESDRAQLMDGKDDPRKENAVERAEYKAAQLDWNGDLESDANDGRLATKAAFNEEEAARNELIDGYQQTRIKYSEEMAEYKDVLENNEAEKIQNEAADRQKNYDDIDEQKANAAVVAEGGNSNRETYIENVNTQKDNVEEQITTLDETAANDRVKTKENLDAIEYNVPKSYDAYYLSKLAEEYPQGVTEESYTQPNKIIIRRIVVEGNKADDYHKVIAKWGTFYFQNGRSISEYIWNLNTVKSD